MERTEGSLSLIGLGVGESAESSDVDEASEASAGADKSVGGGIFCVDGYTVGMGGESVQESCDCACV